MLIVDHLFIFALFIVVPIYTTFSYRKFVGELKAGAPVNRIGQYRETAIGQWLALALLTAIWVITSRPASDLGLTVPTGNGFLIGIVLVVMVCGYLMYTSRLVEKMSDAERLAETDQIGDLTYFLPRTDRELKAIYGLSITAGIVEEIIFRSYVLWYLSHYMPIWIAVFVASIGFGLNHSYQGSGGAIRTGLIGLAFAGLYVLTGSIWLPIIGHILFDVLQARVLKDLLEPQSTVAPA